MPNRAASIASVCKYIHTRTSRVLQVHTAAPVLKRAEWRTAGDTGDTGLVCVRSLSSSRAAANESAEPSILNVAARYY